MSSTTNYTITSRDPITTEVIRTIDNTTTNQTIIINTITKVIGTTTKGNSTSTCPLSKSKSANNKW